MIHFLAVLAVTMLAVPGQAILDAGNRCLREPFHRITPTNELGEIVGPVDRRDWGCLGDQSHGRGRQTITLDGVPVPPPADVCMKEAFPNPATTQTALQYTLPEATWLSLVIYGRLGGGPKRVALVRTLADGTFAAGVHQALWDLNDDRGSRVPPGIYRAVLTVNGSSLCGDIQVP
jgi:hypothetical protein